MMNEPAQMGAQMWWLPQTAGASYRFVSGVHKSEVVH